MTPDEAWDRYRLGEDRMRLGRWEEAAEAFREALSAFPESERRSRAEVLGRLGRARMLAGDRAGEADLLRALALEPHHAPLHADLGDCLLEQKQWKEAGEAYGRALKLDPGNPDYAAAQARAEAIAGKLAP